MNENEREIKEAIRKMSKLIGVINEELLYQKCVLIPNKTHN
jgi:hypothetical protein